MIKFSIIILTYNRLSALMKCLEFIEKNTTENKLNYEIIVVNNASTDGTGDFLWNTRFRFDHFTILNQDKNYGVVARNRAFEKAKGKYIVQCDDDVFLQENWEKVFKYFDKEDVGAVGTEGSLWVAWENRYNKNIKDGDYVDFLTGQFWVFKNEGWWYDENFGFFWHEESDLQMRMRYEKDYRFRQCDKNIIVHLGLRNPDEMDWNLHNKNWNKFVEKWNPLEGKLNLEGKKINCPINLDICKKNEDGICKANSDVECPGNNEQSIYENKNLLKDMEGKK